MGRCVLNYLEDNFWVYIWNQICDEGSGQRQPVEACSQTRKLFFRRTFLGLHGCWYCHYSIAWVVLDSSGSYFIPFWKTKVADTMSLKKLIDKHQGEQMESQISCKARGTQKLILRGAACNWRYRYGNTVPFGRVCISFSFVRPRVQISVLSPAILAENFRCIPESLRANSGIVSIIKPRPILSHRHTFSIYLLINLPFDVV
jgi:hypothetical protein